MKTQFSLRKSGFTMVEIMVVIAILAFLYYTFSRLSFQPQENLTRAERLANKISSVLHDGLLQVTIGRMDNAIPMPNAVTGATLHFGTSACPPTTGSGGSGITWVYTSSLSGQLRPPLFDGDMRYEIESISLTGGTALPSTDCLDIHITRDAMSFSGIPDVNKDNTIVTFTAKYQTMRKKVVFDRRTGRIEVNKN